jgi:hypothetical protein
MCDVMKCIEIFFENRDMSKREKVTLNISWIKCMVEWSGLVCLGMESTIVPIKMNKNQLDAPLF